MIIQHPLVYQFNASMLHVVMMPYQAPPYELWSSWRPSRDPCFQCSTPPSCRPLAGSPSLPAASRLLRLFLELRRWQTSVSDWNAQMLSQHNLKHFSFKQSNRSAEAPSLRLIKQSDLRTVGLWEPSLLSHDLSKREMSLVYTSRWKEKFVWKVSSCSTCSPVHGIHHHCLLHKTGTFPMFITYMFF